MAAHRLIHIHGGERWNVKSRQPHISHDGYLHRVVVVLELACQLLLVGFVAYNRLPVGRVLVRPTHHHFHFLRPVWSKFKYLAVDFDGDRSGERHDHGLAGEYLRSVFLVVPDDVLYQGVDGGIFAQDYFQSAMLLLCPPDLFLCGSIILQLVKLIIQQLHRLLVQIEVDHPTLVKYGACGSIIHCLTHVIYVDVVAENLLRISVSVADRRTCKSDKRGTWQGFSHLPAESLLHRQTLGIPVLIAVLRAVRLVGHHDDVATGGECFIAFIKLLDGGEDDAATLAPLQQMT